MNTLSASTAKRWINSLNEITAVLSKAEGVPGLNMEIWREVWSAKASAAGLSRELMDLTAGAIALEPAS